VKKRFTGRACFRGNVSSSLLIAKKPEEVNAHVQRLTDDVCQDGGGSNYVSITCIHIHIRI
jgi:uroporphyrinogen-III decarboxylase